MVSRVGRELDPLAGRNQLVPWAVVDQFLELAPQLLAGLPVDLHVLDFLVEHPKCGRSLWLILVERDHGRDVRVAHAEVDRVRKGQSVLAVLALNKRYDFDYVLEEHESDE